MIIRIEEKLIYIIWISFENKVKFILMRIAISQVTIMMKVQGNKLGSAC
jgi:hypothetical protein